MKNKNNIQYISKNNLCTACGGCSSICPVNSISMDTNVAGYILADVNNNTCIECAKCLKVCPSVKNNISGTDYNDIFHGNVVCCYIGYAVDNEIRKVSQSGGIVTALLCYLVNSKKVDGAIVNRFDTETKRPKVYYENEVVKIKESSGSYYTQSSVVEEILEHQDKKTAAVLLGCQSESIQLIKEKFPKVVIPEYLIGLVCAGQHSGNYIDEIIKRAGDFNQDISRFRFRDKEAGGWPGHTKIESINGKSKIIDRSIRQSLKSAFEVHRCLFCFDQMNITSDIPVGDPWGIHEKNDKKGHSVIIARTEKGKELIEEAAKTGAIYVEDVSTDRIFQGQTVDSRLKTQFFTTMKTAETCEYETPYNINSFQHIKYEKPSKKQEKILKMRFDFSRKIYSSTNENDYKRMIDNSMKKIDYNRKIRKVKAFPKKVLSFIYNRLK